MWWWKKPRTKQVSAQGELTWQRIISSNVALAKGLSAQESAQMHERARQLIDAKYWEGCNGQRIDEEVQVTIAVQAALLLINKPELGCFDRCVTILVYPDEFRIPVDPESGHFMDASGQAVYRGPVILAWNDVIEEGRDPSLGQNVVIHEFAHQLDFLDGVTDGTPPLQNQEEAVKWHAVMNAAYASHLRRVNSGARTFLGSHAAEDEAEFFAATSERFFTQPHRLLERFPEVYAALESFYRVNPRRWQGSAVPKESAP